MYKRISNDSFDFGMSPVEFVGVTRNGRVDTPVLEKRAALFSKLEFPRKPGHEYLHVISTGAFERYGANSNGDAFNKEAREVNPPHPEDDGKRMIHLPDGLRNCHASFEKTAAVYKEHNNSKKKATPSGYIVKASYNDAMDRGELIIGVESDKWDKELNKVAKQEPIYFSMGADLPYDICSYCGHSRSKAADSCEHVRFDLMKTASDGSQICTYNPLPKFHDISGVVRPADKIAFGLRKVASQGHIIDSATQALMDGDIPYTHDGHTSAVQQRYETLRKLAKLQKEIQAQSAPAVEAFSPEAGCLPIPSDILKQLSIFTPEELFSTLSKYKVVLPLDTFFKLLMDSQDYKNFLPDIARAGQSVGHDIGGVFTDASDAMNALGDDSYRTGSCGNWGLQDIVAKLVASQSVAPTAVKKRIVHIEVLPKIAYVSEPCLHKTAASDMLAREYVKYIVSCAQSYDDASLYLTSASLLRNSNIKY